MANQVYKKGGNLGGARHGDTYQVHVLMLIFERAARAEDTFSDFRLATEMDEAGKFDDAVLAWKSGLEKSKWLFVQVKHKQKAILNELSLFPVEDKDKAKGDFSMYKYIASMSDIMHNERLSGDKKFIIFTNCAIDKAIERWFSKVEMKDEIALLYDIRKQFMYMKVDENRARNIVQTLNQDYDKLFKTIKAIFLDANSDFEVNILAKYRGALVQKVLLVENKKAKFTPRFIKKNNLNPNEHILRQQLFAEDSTLIQLQAFSTFDERVVKILTSKSNSENDLPCLVSESAVFDCLNRLIFAVNQPDNEELKMLIQNDLKYFSPTQEATASDCYTELLYIKLQKMIYDRLDTTTVNVKYLSNEDLCKELSTLQQTIEQSSSDLPTMKFNGTMQNFRIKFASVIQLPEKYPMALITATKDGLLTSLKLFQTLEGQLYRFASFKDIKIGSFRKQLCEGLRKSTSEIMLLLRDDCTKIESVDELLKIVAKNPKVKLILLTHHQQRALEFFGKYEYVVSNDSNTGFDTLEKETQQMLAEKNVLFQGVELSVGEIVQKRKTLLKDGTLEKVILDEKIEIGEGLPEVTLKSIYIPRLIRRCDSNDATDVDTSDSDDDDSKVLPNYNENEFVRKIPSLFQSNDIMVLSAEPGMGKTTLWTHLTPLIKQSYKTSWVFNIKLLECVNELRKVYRFEDIEMVTDALIRVCQIKSHFDNSLFSASLIYGERENNIILLDGFDELPRDTITSVISLLKILQCHSYLFVNTRIHQKVVLERQLNIGTFTLEPISKRQQIMLLKSSCNIQSNNREFSKLIDLLFNKIPRKSLEAAENIIGIPLMVVMLAEIFQPYVEEFSKHRDFSVINTMQLDSLTHLDIYELFSYCSFRRQSIEKQNLDVGNPHTERLLHKQNYLYKGFVKLHSYLGLVKLVKQQKMHFIIRDKKEVLELQAHATLLDSAIVSKYENNVPYFNHASFCEYFAAKCLFDCFCRMQPDQVKNCFVKQGNNRNAPKIQNIDDLYALYLKVLRDYATVRKFFFLMAKEDQGCWKSLEDLFWSMRPYPLQWACEEDFGELVKRLLEEDPSITNCRTKQKETVLHLSAAQGNDTICALLLNANVDENAVSINGQTALHVASSRGHYEVASLLVTRGANLELADSTLQQTPLHLAAQAGHVNIVRLITKKGCDVNKLNKRGWSALHLAAFNGHDEVIKNLLAKKAQLRIGKASNWPMILGSLITHGKSEVARRLVAHEAKSMSDPYNFQEILLWAIRRNHVEIVSAMRIAGPALHFYDTQSSLCTVRLALRKRCFQIAEIIISDAEPGYCEATDFSLPAAVDAGSLECVSIILKGKLAEVNECDENGSTPLELAVKKGHTSIVKMLLEAGANIHGNLLHTAVRNGRREAIKLLLDFGAYVNSTDDNLWTPLHIAAIREKWTCAAELLKSRANHVLILAKDKAGRTALHLAATYDSCLVSNEIISCAERLSPKILEELLSLKDNSGRTALDEARAKGNLVTAAIIYRGEVA